MNDVERVDWSDQKVKDFIKCVCSALSLPVPAEAKPVFLRVALENHVAVYKRGEVEVRDFVQICVAATDNSDDLYRLCFESAKCVSNPLAGFMAQTRGYSFEYNPEVPNLVPKCNGNAALHGLASGQSLILDNDEALSELEGDLVEASHFAALFRKSFIDDGVKCEFVSFRFRARVFHYSRHHCRHNRARIIAALNKRSHSKLVFVFGAEEVKSFFELEFGWTPPSAVDVRELAIERNIAPTFAGLAAHLVGGEYCRRARRFSTTALPSQAALQHLDLDASIIYEACVGFLNLLGADMGDSLRASRRRERKEASKGKENSRRRGARSRSHLR